MKALLAALGAVALIGGVQAFHGNGVANDPAEAPSSFPGAYRLVANGGEASCMLERGASVSPGLSEMEISPQCRFLLPGIERARYWRERPDGTIDFSENGVDPIVVFAAADGPGYESYAPSLPLLSLKAK